MELGSDFGPCLTFRLERENRFVINHDFECVCAFFLSHMAKSYVDNQYPPRPNSEICRKFEPRLTDRIERVMRNGETGKRES